jgi:hypothetical protein
MNAWIKARTAWALGMPSLYRAFSYRLGMRLGLNPVQRLRAVPPQESFFRQPERVSSEELPAEFWKEEAKYFGWFRVPLQKRPPDWHKNPFLGTRIAGEDLPWWEIPDFDSTLGDIKAVWEASRFDWVWVFALQGRAGDIEAVDLLNAWLRDWCQSNRPYIGLNWKCGQEASIRVMNLAMAALLLGQQDTPCKGLQSLIRLHLQRIAPTIKYAISQDNNHGTSEAAALFIGGSWLFRLTGDKQAKKWEYIGRRWLENRVCRLIADDGSFSQHSVNYHRLLLDTLSIVEVWRRNMGGGAFSSRFSMRCKAAVEWLFAFTDPETGDAPNLGSNDGARLLPISATDFRDYRHSVQLASVLFLGATAYPDGSWDALLRWLDIPKPGHRIAATGSRVFDRGGYAKLCCSRVRVFVRYPRFRFRPGHADALHVDLWVGSENVLRDGGSFSYAAESPWLTYFSGNASHNTVQFDDRDQMPRLRRFLYGEWLKTRDLELPRREGKSETFAAAYRDWQGSKHHRRVTLEPSRLLVADRVSGFGHKAVLRWRLTPGDWRYVDDAWRLGGVSIRVTADMLISRMELVEGWESRYYLRRDAIPVLEFESLHAGNFYTEITWHAATPAHGSCM